MVFNRENAIGLVLLLLCAVVALVLLFSIATGTRFRFEGPSWVGTALVILFIAGTIYGFLIRPGRRWSWPWSKDTGSGSTGSPVDSDASSPLPKTSENSQFSGVRTQHRAKSSFRGTTQCRLAALYFT